MKVLILGGGGREHALCEMVRKSPVLSGLWTTAQKDIMGANYLGVDEQNTDGVITAAKKAGIDLVIAGGEIPLVQGIGDRFREVGIAFAGPTKAMAQLESSKGFSKEFCRQYGIATPQSVWCKSESEALAALENWSYEQVVVKADGLAGGKGVVICENKMVAKQAITSILGTDKKFGKAGETILLEEKVEGEEMSFFVLCDGEQAHFVGSAKDYKRAYDGGMGSNTGGMGVISPSPLETTAVVAEIMAQFVEPTLQGMKDRGCPYEGVLFLGMMLTKSKGWQLLEYNVRFGDPECQALAMRCEAGMLESLYLMTQKDLKNLQGVSMGKNHAVVVVVARKGYPDLVEEDTKIAQLERINELAGDERCFVFHAGTKLAADGSVYSNGGRVLGFASSAADAKTARALSYEMVVKLGWSGGFYRTDIGGNL